MEKRLARDSYPLLLSLELLGVVLLVLVSISLKLNDGNLVYVLDDPYIHLSMARNLAQHGVWGVTPEGFSSTSSSLLWTLILAMVSRLGISWVGVPFVLNVMLACAVLWVLHRYLLRAGCTTGLRTTTLLAMVAVIPLGSLVFTGLEHILHMLITLVFFDRAAVLLAEGSERGPDERRQVRWLMFLAVLLVMARFEGLFLAGAVCLGLLVARNIWTAVAIGAAAWAPLILYGAISIAQGWYFLPNSVVLKSSRPEATLWGVISFLTGYGRDLAVGIRALEAFPEGMALVVGALALVIGRVFHRSRMEKTDVLLVLFLTVMAFHLQFARTGWFYRYEAYLIAMGFYALAAGGVSALEAWRSGRRTHPLTAVTVAAGCLLAHPLVARAVKATAETPIASHNIYEQQFQMAEFVGQYYPRGAVVLNDIGLVTYRVPVRVLDLWGLASHNIAVATLDRSLGPDWLEREAMQAGMDIALIYDRVFWNYPGLKRPETGIPGSWKKIGQWHIDDNVVCGDDTVSFYAIRPGLEHTLRQQFEAFSRTLPEGIRHTPGE